MSHDQDEGTTRRKFIYVATSAVAATGATALAWPLIAHMKPAADVIPDLEIDISKIAIGEQIKIAFWGKPIFIRRRTNLEIQLAQSQDLSVLRDSEHDDDRLRRLPNGDLNREILVLVGVCPHFGAVPIGESGDFDGWYCPSHGAHFDTSGRIRKGPSSFNMQVPAYEYVSDTVIKLRRYAKPKI